MNIRKINNECERDSCPFCESKDIYAIGNLGYKNAVSFSSHTIDLSHTPELWRCHTCESSFVQHIVSAETAEMLYSTGQAGDRWSTVAFDQIRTKEVADNMATIFECKGSVLDVGSNTGELLDFAHKLGCKTAGVEFSSASREMLIDKGHGAYSAFEEALGEYDVITAFDLVEHLYNVPAFLEGCREKLTEKGKLAMLTGNIDSLSAVLSGAHWWYAQYPEHVVFPSKKYFSEYSGLKIEKWISTYASIGYKHSICRTGLEFLKSALRGRAYVGLPSLGTDHVLVVLKK